MKTGEGRLRCLAVRPAPTPHASAGDEVFYRKSFACLEKVMDIEMHPLVSSGPVRKVANIALLNPPEVTRFISGHNRAALRERLASSTYDVVLMCNEVTFPMLPVVKAAGVPAVMSAHNVHSVVASTDHRLVSRMMKPLALAFERRWYADPAAELVLISHEDEAGLRRAGINRARQWVSPPGVPKPAALDDGAQLAREAVITGSFGWWRKRRELEAFAADSPLRMPIHVKDPMAVSMLGGQAVSLDDMPDWSWESAIRFGLVIDRFLGGFKLKVLEYIANNCVIIALADVRREFDGLPHAEEFVRYAASKAEIDIIVDSMMRDDAAALADRFRVFKAAVCERYDWERCSVPMRQAIFAAAGRG